MFSHHNGFNLNRLAQTNQDPIILLSEPRLIHSALEALDEAKLLTGDRGEENRILVMESPYPQGIEKILRMIKDEPWFKGYKAQLYFDALIKHSFILFSMKDPITFWLSIKQITEEQFKDIITLCEKYSADEELVHNKISRYINQRILNSENYGENKKNLDDKLSSLIKYYPWSTANDSRCCIEFSKRNLISILSLFAALYDHKVTSYPDTQDPLFGYTESCFTDLLIYALKKRPAGTENQELEHSFFGKNLIRNLLHTASTFDILGSNYSTSSVTKDCYIRLFKEACKKAEVPSAEYSDSVARSYPSR